MTQRLRIYEAVGYELAQAARERGNDSLALTDGDDSLFDRAFKSGVRRLSFKNGVVKPSDVKTIYGVTAVEGLALENVVKKYMLLDGTNVEYLTFDDSGDVEVETIALSEVKAVRVNLEWREFNLLVIGTSVTPIEMANIYTKIFTIDDAEVTLFIVLNDTEYVELDPELVAPPELEDALVYFIVSELRTPLRAEYLSRFEHDKDEYRFSRRKRTALRPYIAV